MMYYIQKDEYYWDDLMMWWALDDDGYIPDLELAKVFTEKEARNICLKPNSDKMRWPVEYIDSIADGYEEFESGFIIPEDHKGKVRGVDGRTCEYKERDNHNDRLVMRATTCLEWMIQDMKHRADQVNIGHYSPELQEAIIVLDKLTS